MIKITVVIPVYDVEKYLPACLDSVLGQSLRDLEVIAIDDASPDRCPEILDAYAAKDERLLVVHLPENHQQGYGRNRGLEMAAGKYVYFLDSDDMITPTAMEELYDLAERDRLDGIMFDSQVLFESAELEQKNAGYSTCRKGNYENRVYGGHELLDALCKQRDWDCYVQREFWRRDYLQEKGIRFPEGTEHEDEYFAFAAVLLAERMRCISAPYFIRRYRENSVMTRAAHPKDFHGYFVNYCKMVDLVERNGLQSYGTDRNIIHMYDRMLWFYPLFAKETDPLAWFKTQEERQIYEFFVYSQKQDLFELDRIENLLDRLPPKSHLWIYGAGIYGSSACRSLEKAGYAVKGFIVTKRENNPDILLGRDVFAIDEVSLKPGEIVVIAASKAYREEIAGLLDSKGWSYEIYTGGR